MMNYRNLEQFAESRIKALFGLTAKVLAELLVVMLPELERRREERQANRAGRKRKVISGDGRPRQVTPLYKVLMTLIYLRHNVSHEVVGGMFGFSADSAENAFHEVVPVLRDLFPKEKWNAEKRWRKGEASWSPEEVDYVIVDSFETPVSRPSLNEKQKRLYSGKKKRHTLKSQVITDQTGEILDIEAGYRGPAADVKVYEDAGIPVPVADKPRLGDKGYVGAKPEVETPVKKPKGGELTEAQRESNRKLSQKRIRVEHGIRRLKAFRIVRDEYRLAVGLFPMVASAVVGLIQFGLIVG